MALAGRVYQLMQTLERSPMCPAAAFRNGLACAVKTNFLLGGCVFSERPSEKRFVTKDLENGEIIIFRAPHYEHDRRARSA